MKFYAKRLEIDRTDNINLIYEDLIKTQLNACGEEPTAPRKKSGQSKYAYETSKSYKQYQIDLIRWLDCMPYLPE